MGQALPPPPGLRKRAWLLPPELEARPLSCGRNSFGAGAPKDGEPAGDPCCQETAAAASTVSQGGVGIPSRHDDAWVEAPGWVDQMQHTRQVSGWGRSLEALEAFVGQHGPFDGVLGFSQGAAVAAVLCALQQQQRQGQRRGDPDCTSSSTTWGFRFAILASGFPSSSPEHQCLLRQTGALRLPSLHVFGGGADEDRDKEAAHEEEAKIDCEGKGATTAQSASETAQAIDKSEDRQVGAAESEQLVQMFDPACGRRVVRHGQGHLIPSRRSVVQQVREFLIQRREEKGGTEKP